MRLTDLDGCVGLLSSTVSYENWSCVLKKKKAEQNIFFCSQKKNKKK